MKLSSLSGSDTPPGNGFRAALPFLLIFILLTAGIVTVGYLSYRSYKQNCRIEAGHELSSIAELKVGELTKWRAERVRDGFVFFKNASFCSLVRRFFEQPADSDAQRQLLDWISKFSACNDYDMIRLLDTQGVTRLSLPAGDHPVAMKNISSVLMSAQVSMTDFYRNNDDHRVYLSLLVPIIDESDANRPLGLLALRIDPSTYLYPFIQRWPSPSRTAETLLVRREGNEAVFLNELRFQTNAALNLRIPLSKTEMPSVQAILGRKGIAGGKDYRGMPVMAAIEPVPDSPWFLVARQDIAEVDGPIQARLLQTIVMVGVLIFGAAACTGLVWRNQRAGFYREKTLAMEALRKSEAVFRSYFELPLHGLTVTSVEKGWLKVNDYLCSILGYTREEIVRMTWAEMTHPDDLAADVEQFNRLLAGQIERYELEKRFIRKDGTAVWTTIAVGCVRKADGTADHIVCSIDDITARKEGEKKLAETIAELRASNQDLEQFAYVASHDMQEPLRMVANYMQLLERRYKDKLDQDGRDFIGFAADGAVRMQQLIDSLLEYSRLQFRKKPFESVDLEQTIQRILRDLGGRILETGAQIAIDPLPHVYGDELQIGLIFQNLISNALKFHGENSPEVHIAAEELSKHWKITVRDNGIGIAPEYQERIFKIFQRLHSRAEYPGTGIGLAVCRRIIERHGGEIGVVSEHGKGSSFWFTLPKKKEEGSHGRI